MKKVILTIILIIIIAASVLLYLTYQDKKEELEKALKTPAESYFVNNVSSNSNTSTYRITLKMLKKANQNGENYNLKKLNKCDDKKTYADVTVNFSDGSIKKTEITLNCKMY